MKNTKKKTKEKEIITPAHFTKLSPMGSVLQKSEAETIARNIMVVLSKNGNSWRELTYKEYKEYCSKERTVHPIEENYFNQVIDYCKNPDTAALFAPGWKIEGEITWEVKGKNKQFSKEEVDELFKEFIKTVDFVDFTKEYGISGWKKLNDWLEKNV